MRLSEAATAFLESSAGIPDQDDRDDRAEQSDTALSLDRLVTQLADPEIEQLTPALLRDVLARWYVEEASAYQPSTRPPLPAAEALISTLKDFFRWSERYSDAALNGERLQVLDGLTETVPRAIAISVALAADSARRGGAISFPEFLTTFAEGGQSEYDVGDPAGEAGVREGYFRILDVEGREVAAEELIQEERVSPILFPEKVALLLAPGYILNLELVRTAEGWQVAGSGFAYPPGTEF